MKILDLNGLSYYTTNLINKIKTMMSAYIPLSGSKDITGILKSNSEIQSTSQNAFRLISPEYGTILRNDGTRTYVLLTNKNDSYGSWNDLRPLIIENTSGAVIFENGLQGNLNGNATTATASQTSSFFIRGNGADNIEGGELNLANTDGTNWVLDSYNNTFRLFDNKNGNMIMTCDKDNPSNSYFAGQANSATNATRANYISGWADNRNVNTTPNEYNGRFEIKGLKTNPAIGNPDSSTYSTVAGLRAWHDPSGGDTHEFAFTAKGQIFQRHGASDTWGSWNKIYTSENMSYGTNDLVSGTSTLETGNFYFQYE